MKQEAKAAAQEAARQKAEAEKATAEAVAQQQALAAETDKARPAAAQVGKSPPAGGKRNEKQELRARLLQQLNSILATRDSARGLVANMSDVLFRSGSFELLPAARERLAKVSGIVLAYPSLHVTVEGHTDSVGTDDYNQQLSERRAQAVRDYFVQQGIPPAAVEAHGYGKTEPIASNDTAEGRQQNRRVELILSGDAIGTDPPPKPPANKGGKHRCSEAASAVPPKRSEAEPPLASRSKALSRYQALGTAYSAMVPCPTVPSDFKQPLPP